MHSRRIIVILMIICMLALTSVPAAYADKPGGEPPPVEIQGVQNGSITFSPEYLDVNNWTRATGTMQMWTPFLADGVFEMYLSGAFYTAQWVTGNVPYHEIAFGYSSDYGGYAWGYDSGVMWYNGSVTWNLVEDAYANSTGGHRGIVGSDYYLPSGWWATAFCYVQ